MTKVLDQSNHSGMGDQGIPIRSKSHLGHYHNKNQLMRNEGNNNNISVCEKKTNINRLSPGSCSSFNLPQSTNNTSKQKLINVIFL